MASTRSYCQASTGRAAMVAYCTSMPLNSWLTWLPEKPRQVTVLPCPGGDATVRPGTLARASAVVRTPRASSRSRSMVVTAAGVPITGRSRREALPEARCSGLARAVTRIASRVVASATSAAPAGGSSRYRHRAAGTDTARRAATRGKSEIGITGSKARWRRAASAARTSVRNFRAGWAGHGSRDREGAGSGARAHVGVQAPPPRETAPGPLAAQRARAGTWPAGNRGSRHRHGPPAAERHRHSAPRLAAAAGLRWCTARTTRPAVVAYRTPAHAPLLAPAPAAAPPAGPGGPCCDGGGTLAAWARL